MAKSGILLSVTENQEGKTPRIVTESNGLPVKLLDGNNNPLSSYYDAETDQHVLNVHNADVHNQIFNKYMHQHTATTTTLAAPVAGDGTVYQITVADSTGFLAGDYIHINTTSVETTHPSITDITGNVITLDRRLDKAHEIGDEVLKVIINLASQNGTMASPQEYWMAPENGSVFHVARLLFEATHDSASDLGNFLSIPELANGVLLRARVNGQYGTFTNWKRNGHMKTDMFNVESDPRSGGQGSFGTSGRGTFTQAGGVVRLDGSLGDRIELYVQDTLLGLGLNTWTMKMQGHYEGG